MLQKKTALLISVCLSLFSAGILTGYFAFSLQQRPQAQEQPPSVTISNPQEEVKKVPQPQQTDYRTFFLKAQNDQIILYTCDQSGTMQQESILDYIDFYSLEPEQQEQLINGVPLALSLIHIFASVGLKDTVCPAKCYYASYNRIRAEKEIHVYPLSGHEGGGAYHDTKKLWKIKEIIE